MNHSLIVSGINAVDVPNLALTGAFTIETWIKFDPDDPIDNKDGIVRSGAGYREQDLNFYDGYLRLYSGRKDHVVATTQAIADVWTHYTITRDENGVLKIYVNGVLDATSTGTFTDTFVVSELGAGAAGVSDASFDNLRIWNRALSETEITSNMYNNIETSPDLLRNYTFEGLDALYDFSGNTSPQTLPIGVTQEVSDAPLPSPANQAPLTSSDSAQTEPDTSVVIDILANDTDIDGSIDPSSVAITTSPLHGTVSISPTGAVTYTPDLGYEGQDSFTYTVSDGTSTSQPTDVSIVIASPSDNYELSLDGSAAVDVPNLALTGAFTIETWIKFDPDDPIDNKDGIVRSGAGYREQDLNFYDGYLRLYSGRKDHVVATTQAIADVWTHYTITRDENGVLKIYVNGVLDATSTGTFTDTFVVSELGAGTAGVSDASFDNLRIWDKALSETEITSNMYNNIETSPDLLRNYTFEGLDALYDFSGNTSPQTLPNGAILQPSDAPIGPPQNHAPISSDDAVTTPADMPVEIDILANDTDSDGTIDPSTVVITSGPAHGSVVVSPITGVVTYTPDNGFEGTDGFTYTVSDGEDISENANVTIVIGNQAPVAVDDTVQVRPYEWIAINVIANDYDTDGQIEPASVNIVTQPENGQLYISQYVPGEVYYISNPGYYGTDSFSYTISDGNKVSEPAEVVIAVGDYIENNVLEFDGGTVLSTPTFSLVDSFSIEAWVKLDANDPIDGNDGLLRSGRKGSDQTINFYDGHLRLYSSKKDAIVANHETEAGVWTHYAITRDDHGTLKLYVNGVLDTTSTGMFEALTIKEIGGSITGNLNGKIDNLRIWDYERSAEEINDAFDKEVDPLSPGLVRDFRFSPEDYGNLVDETNNAGSTVLLAGSEIVSDLDLLITEATIDPDTPMTVDDYFKVSEDCIAVPLTVLMNDIDPNGDVMSIVSLTQPIHGVLQLVDNELLYTPDLDFTGQDSFTYRASDGVHESRVTSVEIDVLPSHEQSQWQIDARVAPELSPSGLMITLEKVAQIPVGKNGAAARMDTMTTQGERIFVTTEGTVKNESKIYVIEDDGNGGKSVDLFFDVGAAVLSNTGRNLDNSNIVHGGLRGLAFHPDFETNGIFYTSLMEERPTDPTGHTYLSDAENPIAEDSVLVEWQVDLITGDVIENSYREVFRIGMPVYDHPIKMITFNKYAEPGDEDYGLLYVTHGDGSVQSAIAGDGLGNDALGKILRIDPLQSGTDSYTIPTTNPFVSDPDIIDEAYAIGFRNPHTISFAQDMNGNTQLIATSVGRDNIDEVNVIVPGGNYGWGEREGPFVHVKTSGGINTGITTLPSDEAQNDYIYPVAFMGHDGPVGAGFVGQGLAGGHVIADPNSLLADQYVFVEFATTGKAYHIDFSDMLDQTTTLDPLDPLRDSPDDLTWLTPQELTIMYDHDNDDTTPALIRSSIKDVLDDEPSFQYSYAKGLTRADLRLGEGPDGELYVMNKRNGWVYVVEETVSDDLLLL